MQIKKNLLLLLVMLTCGIAAAWAQQHVTIADATGGTVTVDNAAPAAGEMVTITVTPDAGYQIAKSDIEAEAIIDPGNAQAPGLKVDGPNVGMKIELQGDDPANLKESRTYTFTMPEAPLSVLITAHFMGVLEYNISISPDIVNGTVTSDKDKASYQETVILTVTPAEGYELETLQATWIEGGTQNAIPATFAGNGMYTFDMPAHDVTITATFTKKPYTITVDDGIEHGSVVAPATAYYGDQVTVTVAPVLGYELETLKATYYQYGTSETELDITPTGNDSYTFEMPAYNVTIEATFTKKPYNITVADGIEHGSVTAPATACMGDQVTLTVTPDPGYVVATLQATSLMGGTITAIDPTPQGNGIYTFEMPARDVTIEATFTKKLYNIGIADGIEHGSISAPATAYYDDPVTVTVTPDTGYELDQLYYSYDAGGGVHEPEISIENGQFNMPNFDVTIYATFKLKKYNVEVEEAIDGDHGFVQAVPSTCSMGETVTLITSADTGYAITTLQATYEEGTTEVNLPLTPAENDTYTFVMPAADVHVHWIVSKVQYTITVNPSEHGTVTAPATAEYGQEVTLTVTPDAHYMLESLSVAYTNGNPVTVTDNKFTMPAANVVVNATFKPVIYNITVAPTEHGTVSAPATAAYGTEVNVTVTPDEGYELDELVVMPAYNSVTCAEVIAGADDMIYRVSGKITHISSMEYGNLYLADNTGEIFIYGTLDKEGNTNNFESLGLKEGDYVIVEGPKTTYQGIVELIDVTVVGVEIETNVTGNGYTFTMPACDVVVSATFKSTSHTYTVAGEPAALFGSETPWDVNNSNGEMTAGDGGIYTWTSQPTHLEGDVMFKIVTDKNWNNPSYPADNYIISNVKPGTYTVTITLNPATGEINVNVVGQADVFVIGQINGNTQFAPNDGLQMTTEDGKIYTAQVTIDDIEAGYGFFAFTHKLGANADDWGTVNAYRFMAESYYDFLVTGSTMNSQLPIDYKDNSAMKIPAGEYTLTVDLENMYLTINGGTQLSYILASGVEGVDYTVLNDVFIVERSAVTKQFFVSDGDNNWIAINAGDYYGNMGSLKGGYYSGVFGGKNLNPYLNMSSTPFEGVDVDSVKPNEYSLAHNFTPKVDEVIIISKAYYKASDNALRAYAPGGVQGPSCTVDNTLYSYDFEDGKKYTVTGVINIKEPWATTGDKGLMDYDYAFQNYKLLVTDVIEEPIPTAINGIFLEEGVKSVRYYNAAGVESNVPFQGINIVVKEMNDGSRVTTKMVK